MAERVAFGFGLWGAVRIGNRRILSFVKGLANHYLRKREEIGQLLIPSGRRVAAQSTVHSMAYTPQHVANYFLDRAAQERTTLSPLKLLKLVYIAYGWCLAVKDDKLFNEKIEAWKHGPVIPSIYHEFKHFGSNPIIGRSVTVEYDEDDHGRPSLDFQTPRIPSEDADTNFLLDTVWKSYKDFSAWKLREITHEDGTPWKRVYRDGVRGIAIRDEDIREHYVERIGRYVELARSAAQERRAS